MKWGRALEHPILMDARSRCGTVVWVRIDAALYCHRGDNKSLTHFCLERCDLKVDGWMALCCLLIVMLCIGKQLAAGRGLSLDDPCPNIRAIGWANYCMIAR